MKKAILTATGILLFTLSYSQYSYRINVSGNGRGCTGTISNTVSGTFNGSGTTSLPTVRSSSISGTLFTGNYSGSFTGRLNITGRFSCACFGDPGCIASASSTINVDVNIPIPTGILLCEGIFGIPNGTGSSNYDLSANLTVYKSTLDTPILVTAPTDFCSANAITLRSTDVLQSYQWEARQGSAGGFVPIKTTSTSQVTITQDELLTRGFSNPSGQFFFRIRNPNCIFTSLSDPAGGFQFRALPPTASVDFFPPSCSGGNNGRVRINSISGAVGVGQYRLILKRRFPDNSYQVFDTATDIIVPSTALPAIFSLGTTGHSIIEGSYQVRVENDFDIDNWGSCWNEYTQSITSPPPLTLSLNSATPASCHSANAGTKDNGTITLSVGNGVTSFTYQVSKDGGAFAAASPNDPNTRSPVFSGLTEGDYKFIVTDANSCSSAETAIIQVAEPPVLTVSNNPATDVLCKGKPTGAIDLNITGGNGGYTYSWSATGIYAPYVIPPTEDISGVNAGVYSVTVTDANACRPSASPHIVTINEPTADFTLNSAKRSYGGFDVTCAQNDGEISLSLLNENTPLQSVIWKRNGSTFSPSSLLSASSLTAANYTIDIVDRDGCDASAALSLSPHPGIAVVTEATSNFNGFNTKCPTSAEGEGRVLNVTNGFGTLRYAWFDGTMLPTIKDLMPGSYNVTVTDDNGCADSENLIITAPPAIQPRLQVTSNFNGAQISCPSAADGRMEAFPLNGFGGYSYAWDHDATLVTSFADDLSQGTYNVKVTDSYGCFVTQSLGINDPAPMNLTLTKKSYNGSDLSCHDVPDGEILLAITNGAAPYGYAWSNGMNMQNIKDLPAGDYDVVVTDANGCTQPGLTTIFNPAPLALTIQHVNDFNGYDVSCKGFSDGSAKAIPTGGTAPYFYSWSNSVVNDLNPGLVAGDYTVQVRDANGCPNSSAITLTEPTVFLVTGGVNNPVSCFGLSDAEVELAASGGVTPYEYSKDQLSWQPQAIFSSLNFGTKDFYSRDANGCLSSIQRVVPQPDPIAISFQNIIDARCNDPVGSAQATVTGGNSGFTFSWFEDISNQPMNSGDVLQNAIAGIYRVEVKDVKNCAASDLVAVSSIGGAVFTIDNITPVSCFGFNDGASTVSVTSGISPFTYLWSDGQSLPTASGLLAGRTFITVTDGLGCKTLKPVIIPTPDPLASQYNKTLPLCVGDCNGQIEALPSGGTSPYQFDWVNLGSVTDLANNLCAGSYDLRVTDSHGCLLTEKIELKNPDPLKIIPQVVKPICLGRCDGSISVTGTGGTGPYRFDWDAGTNATSISNLCPGDYGLQMKDAHDCPVNDQINLPAGDPLPLDLGSKATLCVGQSKVLDAGSTWVQANWTSTIGFSETSPIVTIKDPGIYYFKGINSIGCIGLDTFRLETSLDLLKAEFLTPSEVFVGDTLVAIDISWPLPERVGWNYPTSWRSLASSTPDILITELPVAGTFTLGMRSFLAECRALREKTIVVLEKTQGSEAGRLGYTETALIREFTLFPNPNDGRFDVNITLSKERDVQLRIVQFPTGIIKSEFRGQSSSAYRIGFDLPDLAQGLYIVLLKVGEEEKFLRFFKK